MREVRKILYKAKTYRIVSPTFLVYPICSAIQPSGLVNIVWRNTLFTDSDSRIQNILLSKRFVYDFGEDLVALIPTNIKRMEYAGSVDYVVDYVRSVVR